MFYLPILILLFACLSFCSGCISSKTAERVWLKCWHMLEVCPAHCIAYFCSDPPPFRDLAGSRKTGETLCQTDRLVVLWLAGLLVLWYAPRQISGYAAGLATAAQPCNLSTN